MSKYGQIAIAAMNPASRRTGRTTALLMSAPKNTIIVAADESHRHWLESNKPANREDLRVVNANRPEALMGLHGPIVLDHHTVESLLMSADRDIDAAEREISRQSLSKDPKVCAVMTEDARGAASELCGYYDAAREGDIKAIRAAMEWCQEHKTPCPHWLLVAVLHVLEPEESKRN